MLKGIRIAAPHDQTSVMNDAIQSGRCARAGIALRWCNRWIGRIGARGRGIALRWCNRWIGRVGTRGRESPCSDVTAGSGGKKLESCRKLLKVEKHEIPPVLSWHELLLKLTGKDVLMCEHCHQGRYIIIGSIQKEIKDTS